MRYATICLWFSFVSDKPNFDQVMEISSSVTSLAWCVNQESSLVKPEIKWDANLEIRVNESLRQRTV